MATIMPSILHNGVVVVLPDSEYTGEVVDKGDGTGLRIGDEIVFAKEPVVEVEINDVIHRLVREEDVLGWIVRTPDPAPILPG